MGGTMGTHSEMGAPQGLLSIFLVSGLLLGTCSSEQACVDDACFDQSIQQLKIERSKTDQTSGLNYKEQTTDLVATIDVIGVCLPGVNPSVLADSFLSCSNEKVEEVCTMVKRGGWRKERGRALSMKMRLLQRSRGSMEAKMLSGNAFRSLRCMNTSTTTMTTPTTMMSMTTTTWRNLHQEAVREEQWVITRKRAKKPKQMIKQAKTERIRRIANQLQGKLQGGLASKGGKKQEKPPGKQERGLKTKQPRKQPRKQSKQKKQKGKQKGKQTRKRKKQTVKKTHERRRCQSLA